MRVEKGLHVVVPNVRGEQPQAGEDAAGVGVHRHHRPVGGVAQMQSAVSGPMPLRESSSAGRSGSAGPASPPGRPRTAPRRKRQNPSAARSSAGSSRPGGSAAPPPPQAPRPSPPHPAARPPPAPAPPSPRCSRPRSAPGWRRSDHLERLRPGGRRRQGRGPPVARPDSVSSRRKSPSSQAAQPSAGSGIRSRGGPPIRAGRRAAPDSVSCSSSGHPLDDRRIDRSRGDGIDGVAPLHLHRLQLASTSPPSISWPKIT